MNNEKELRKVLEESITSFCHMFHLKYSEFWYTLDTTKSYDISFDHVPSSELQYIAKEVYNRISYYATNDYSHKVMKLPQRKINELCLIAKNLEEALN